jgi:hypothetical protein
MCAGCLLKYGRLSNYIPRLVVSDRQNSAEDQIIKSCESTASTTKSSPDSLDFFDIVEQVSTGMVAVY